MHVFFSWGNGLRIILLYTTKETYIRIWFSSCYGHSLYFPVHTIGRRYPIRALVRGCAGRGPAGIFGSCRWGQEQEGRPSPLCPTPGGSALGNSIINVFKTFDFRPRRSFWIRSYSCSNESPVSPDPSPMVHLRSPPPQSARTHCLALVRSRTFLASLSFTFPSFPQYFGSGSIFLLQTLLICTQRCRSTTTSNQSSHISCCVNTHLKGNTWHFSTAVSLLQHRRSNILRKLRPTFADSTSLHLSLLLYSWLLHADTAACLLRGDLLPHHLLLLLLRHFNGGGRRLHKDTLDASPNTGWLEMTRTHCSQDGVVNTRLVTLTIGLRA